MVARYRRVPRGRLEFLVSRDHGDDAARNDLIDD